MASPASHAQSTRLAGSFSICNSSTAKLGSTPLGSRRRTFGVQTLTPTSKAKALDLAVDLYRQINKLYDRPIPTNDVLKFLEHPELWAEHQIRYRGWGYAVTEKIVRRARILRAQYGQGV